MDRKVACASVLLDQKSVPLQIYSLPEATTFPIFMSRSRPWVITDRAFAVRQTPCVATRMTDKNRTIEYYERSGYP